MHACLHRPRWLDACTLVYLLYLGMKLVRVHIPRALSTLLARCPSPSDGAITVRLPRTRFAFDDP